jgi:hypothetical protein
LDKKLSVFIDESGDFGSKSDTDFYLVGILFHAQEDSIDAPLQQLNQKIKDMDFQESLRVHTGPIIRREKFYRNIELSRRRLLFRAMYDFLQEVKVKYDIISAGAGQSPSLPLSEYTMTPLCGYGIILIDRREERSGNVLSARLTVELFKLFHRQEARLKNYSQIVAYYDNGQVELKKIIHEVCSLLPNHVEFKENLNNKRLHQLIDMITSMELIAAKGAAQSMSNSEKMFFGEETQFRQYLSEIRKKRLALAER